MDEFISSEDWVDLLEVVRRQLITGRSMGLKETAPLAGFSWRTDDGGGTLAIVKYEQAVDEEVDADGRATAQRWILEYNEDDVRATAALREWLDGRRGACRQLRWRRAESPDIRPARVSRSVRPGGRRSG